MKQYWQRLIPRTGWRGFFSDLKREISEDRVGIGAAALAYFLMFSLFPALLVLLALTSFIPVERVDQAMFDFINQGLPRDAASLISKVLAEIRTETNGGLISAGILAAVWAASSGFYAVMQQMNIAYEVKESRPFFKARLTALAMLGLFILLALGCFTLIVFGGQIQEWLAGYVGRTSLLLDFFAVSRWVILFAAGLTAFSLFYYLGPNVRQKFICVTPGSVVATVLLAAASVGFNVYVSNFGNYAKTYGSIGAVVVLLLWLYIAGWVLLLGAEINSLYRSYESRGRPLEMRRGPSEGPLVSGLNRRKSLSGV